MMHVCLIKRAHTFALPIDILHNVYAIDKAIKRNIDRREATGTGRGILTVWQSGGKRGLRLTDALSVTFSNTNWQFSKYKH